MHKTLIEESFEKVKSGRVADVDTAKLLPMLREIISSLNKGELSVLNKSENGDWVVNEYIKKSISLALKFFEKSEIEAGYTTWCDKLPVKRFNMEDARALPGTNVRYGAYIAKSAVLCPCFVNIGAYVDEGSMIDSFTTIGSCAYIGKNCHISEGVCIGGVLEPVNATPVIIEDNCFVGAKSVIAEGVIVQENSVIAASVTLTRSTKIINRVTNEIIYGVIPPNSLVIPGSYRISDNLQINCAILMNKEKDKDVINAFLR